ncbi:NYN domain-containing protein [Rubellimicrobium roseum]|uniref:NYN domain-containing protein n=1 Tax=Rubellimicrobium roseum TaxID=687525 RepID=UPI00159BBCA0|nr:NYN domain-containing protein [Rubellimicrobium roseum]
MEQQAIAAARPPLTEARVALLVDGDNIAADWAGQLLVRAARLGSVLVKRVYCDVGHTRNWEASAGFGLRVARIGPNAADMLLTIDAVELAHRGDLSAFVLASSDGGFAPLARYLVERGTTVLGLGGATAPPDWRKSCSRFEVLQRGAAKPTPLTTNATSATPHAAAASRPAPVVPVPNDPGAGLVADMPRFSDTDARLRALIAKEGRDGGLAIQQIGPRLNALHKLTLTSIGASG